MGNLNPTALYIYTHGNIFTTEEVAQIFYEAMNFLYNEYILLIPLVLHKFGSIVLYFTTAASFFLYLCIQPLMGRHCRLQQLLCSLGKTE